MNTSVRLKGGAHLTSTPVYFQITNPYRAAFGITDLRQALMERAQTTLRHVVGARAVQSVVTERDAIALEIEEIVGDVADKWGVAIEGILIKYVFFYVCHCLVLTCVL